MITRWFLNSILWIDQIFSQDTEYNADLYVEILLEDGEYGNDDLQKDSLLAFPIRF